jgi:hypothetical protein
MTRFHSAAAGFLLFLASQLPAQELSVDIGGKIGVPVTRNIPPSVVNFGQTTTAQGPRLAAAPTFTLFVDDRVAVDVEVLFRPVRYETDTTSPSISSFDTTRATALEIPIIVSYHFGDGPVRPYAGVGLIPYEKAWGRIDAHSILHNQGDRQTHVVFTYQGFRSRTVPLIVDGGIDYDKGRWRIRPEIRYTHSEGSSGRRRNQWDVLAGVSFRAFQSGTKRKGP